eukprot:COSAG02_NODE_6493_length_3538_cov_2.563536_1_plen_57_part_00
MGGEGRGDRGALREAEGEEGAIAQPPARGRKGEEGAIVTQPQPPRGQGEESATGGR